MRTTITALAMFVTASVATGQQQGPYASMGYGTTSCAEFARMYQLNPTLYEVAYFNWAQGYMSGANIARATDQTGDTVTYRNLIARSIDDQQAYLRSFCNDHPLSDYVAAVNTLFGSMPKLTMPRDKFFKR